MASEVIIREMSDIEHILCATDVADITISHNQMHYSQYNTLSLTPHELINSGTCSMPLGESLNFMTFIDDYYRKCWIYLLKEKDDVLVVFKRFHTFTAA